MAVNVCPTCLMPASYSSETEALEMYHDGPGQPNEPGRYTLDRQRRMVPGRTVETWQPCGHTRTST